MLERKEVFRGDVIFDSPPFAHVLVKDLRGRHCEHCLEPLSTTAALQCPGCSLLQYCSPACLQGDLLQHAPECDRAATILALPDISRLVARVLLRLHHQDLDTHSETLPWGQASQ